MKRLAMLTLMMAATGAAPAAGQVAFGGQVNWSDDRDLGVGIRAELPLSQVAAVEPGSPASPVFLIGSFDWFFPDEPSGADIRYFEINLNAAYPLEVEGFRPYVGAGLNVANLGADFESELVEDRSDTEVGLNALAGLKFLLGAVDAFAEARLEVGGGDQLVLTFGALLGGR